MNLESVLMLLRPLLNLSMDRYQNKSFPTSTWPKKKAWGLISEAVRVI
jgi:hypothetical protein